MESSPVKTSGNTSVQPSTPLPAINVTDQLESHREIPCLDITSPNTIADKEGLQNGLRFFDQNKINKDNAWSLSLIDNFSSLIAKHHKSVNNFQIVNRTLEASSKIYGIRVDSVYLDTMRVTSGLTNTIQAPTDSNNNETGPTSDNEHRQCHPPAVKAPRKRRNLIAQNDETLNAKLDTNPFIDAFFEKLNTNVGDMSKSDCLIQTILPTENSELLLKMDYPFWDNGNVEPVEHLDEYEYDNSISLPLKLDEISKHTFREQLNGYKIKNTPSDDDSIHDSVPIEKTCDRSHLEFAFDMDAEIEPITDVQFLDVDLENAELNELTEADQDALKACEGLRRNPVILQDLRPIDSSSGHLEYSYRPLDNISNYWAGPSYWKFRKFRQITSSFPSRNNVKKTKKNKGIVELLDDFDDRAFIPLTNKSKSKLRQVNIDNKWNSTSLKLPTNFNLDSNLFLKHPLAHRLPISSTGGYNLNNADDTEYCNNFEHNINEGSVRNGSNNFEDVYPNPSIDLANETVAEIETIFEGAPQMVKQTKLPYASEAKHVNMKQLKKSCFRLINHFFQKTNDVRYKDGVTFKEVYAKLPTTVTEAFKDALSLSIAFYAILHLANENQLRLMEVSDDNFMIRRN